jgi:aerobic carbon-monoxide dehydrogenase medium subunit
MKPPLFDYVRPSSIVEAANALRNDPEALVIAGGQSLVPTLNLRLARPSAVVDISRLPGLSGIETDDGRVVIGALTTHSTIEFHDWPLGLEALPRGVSHIGYRAIRNRGTIGGSIAHADPAAELPSLMVALDAGIELRSPDASRTIPAADFFLGYYTTARGHDEIVTSVTVPRRPGLATGFAEFSRRIGDFAVALAAVATWEDEGQTHARVVVGGLDSRPRRIAAIEDALVDDGDWRDVCTPDVIASFTDPSTDIHGSAEHRLHLGAEMIRRAIDQMHGGTG